MVPQLPFTVIVSRLSQSESAKFADVPISPFTVKEVRPVRPSHTRGSSGTSHV